MPRLNGRVRLAALVLGWGCLLTLGAAPAPAQEKDAEPILKKSDKLTSDDEKDTTPETRNSHHKVYKVKLSGGQAYRIDLSSGDFDTFLRLEDASGKQLAFNDDIDIAAKNLNSRLLFMAPKTGEYRVIATTFEPGKTGSFLVEVKPASAAETVEARVQTRLAAFATASPADQRKLVAEFTKEFQDKGEKLTLKDAQVAAQLAMQLPESETEFTRATCKTFSKLFDAADDKQARQLSPFLSSMVLKNLDKIGKEIEITGKTTDGKEFDLKNLKGKVVLVDFWATWCGPCVQEIPNIVEAHKKYHSKGFEVIGVSLDRSDDAIVKFVEAKKLPWSSINIEDGKKLATKFGVNAIPHPILVDRDGRIASMRARGPQLHAVLERLIGDKK